MARLILLLPLLTALAAPALSFGEETPLPPIFQDIAVQPELYPPGDYNYLIGRWEDAAKEYAALASADPEVLIRLGESYFLLGNMKSAEEAFGKAQKEDASGRASAMIMMLKAVKSDGSLERLRLAAEKSPEDAELARALGMAYMKRGQDTKALESLATAVGLDPGDFIASFLKGSIYERHFAFMDAIREYKAALEVNPVFAQAINNIGYSYKEKRYYTYAIQMYRRAVVLDPANAGYHYNLGNALTHKEQHEDAFTEYLIASELDPEFAKSHYNLGRAYMRKNMFEDAIKEFELYVKYWNDGISPHDAPPKDAVKIEINDIRAYLKAKEEEAAKKENAQTR